MARAVVPRTAAAVDHADTELIGQSGHRISLWCFLLAFFCHFDRSEVEWRNLITQWHKPHCGMRSLDSAFQ